MAQETEVIIVGGGPVGTLLASELALHGIKVLVLEAEKSAEETPWKVGPPGRRGLNIYSSQTLQRRGLLEQVFPKDQQSSEGAMKIGGPRFAGHFAGIMIDSNKVDYSQFKHYIPNPSTLGGPVNVAFLADVFAARAQELGARVMKGTPVTEVVQYEDHVEVFSGERKFSALWVVGTDGAHSVVRKAGDFQLVGSEAEMTGYVAICELHEDDRNILHPGFNPTKEGMYIALPKDNMIFALDFDGGAGRSEPVTVERFQSVIQRASGTNVRVKSIKLPNAFTDRTKQATEYRRGRLILAGDSAHYHSPLGAQGLNGGIGDAMNLGFKLAATIKGTAAPGLLDTYQTERWPIGERVLEWSRAQVAILRPDLAARATAKITRELLDTRGGATYYFGRFSGLATKQELGGGEHDFVGRNAPDYVFADGSRLGSKMVSGKWLVVDFRADEKLAEFVRETGSAVELCSLKAEDDLGVAAMLVRPDGLVAWVSTGEADVTDLRRELGRWITL